jgi:hypothetical protein
MESSPRKLEIAQMDRETLNKLYYLALEKVDKMTRDNNVLLTLVDDLELFIRDVIIKTNRSDSRLETSIPNLSESMVMVTPETPKQRGIISRKTKNWRITSQTPPESPNILYRHLDKPSYRDQFIANTPPRKGGKRGKNIRKNKTMRKYLKK